MSSNSQDSAGLADPAALEAAAQRLMGEAVTIRVEVQDEVRQVVAAGWVGAAASSFKDDTQMDWFITLGRAQQLEDMASTLRNGASAVRAEIDRRRREREAREAAARRNRQAAAKKTATTG